jgi:predicted dehydrogenase
MSVNLGLIGAGRWGKRYIQTIAQLSEARLTHLCTSKSENAKLVGHPVQVVVDWKTLCREKSLHGVIIASPPDSHAAIVKECLNAKKPCMVEKPLCMNLKDALEIQKLVKETQVPVLVDHTQLFHSAYEVLSSRINPSEIKFIHSEGKSYGPFRKDVPVLWDRAPHDLSLCLDLMKAMPTSVFCMGAGSIDASPLNSQILSLRLEFKNGVEVWIDVSHLSAQKHRRLSVFGENRIMVLDDLVEHKLVEYSCSWENRLKDDQSGLGESTPISTSPEMPLARAVKTFVRGISDKPTNHFGVDLAVNIIRIIVAAEESLKQGSKKIDLS